MKAIAVTPGTTGARVVDRPEPVIAQPADVMLDVCLVGVCGTDREEALGGRALPPPGQAELVIGHEMLGRVAEVGSAVTRVKPGDYAVFTVRRGCGRCLPCSMGRSDMCLTGEYTERGIWGLDGYHTERVVDSEEYVVRVPDELASVAVLAEPLTIAEKAIDEAVRIQFARRPDAQATPDWLFARHCLVAGLGPVGLLAAMALRLRGAEVYGLDVVNEGTPRPEWLRNIGGRYVDGRMEHPEQLLKDLGPMELIFEAAGVASLEFNLLDALGQGGVYVLTGIPGGDPPLQLHAAELMRRLVLNNQAMVGSVNASRGHFQMAVDDLEAASCRWEGHVERLITHRFGHEEAAQAMMHHGPEEIKSVVVWSGV